MAEFYLLNKSDHDLIQEFITASKNRRINVQSRSPYPDAPYNAPEVYLALPQTSISALTETGTSTGTTANTSDTPGSGTCDLYQVIKDDTGTPAIIGTGYSVTVFNNSQAVIGKDWVQVQKDKFGSWWVIPSVAVSNQIILGVPTVTGTGSSSFGAALAGEIIPFIALDTSGNKGSEIPLGTTVTAYIRKGMVRIVDRTYMLVAIPGADTDYEVVDPELEFTGYANTTAAKGSTVNVQIWNGSPAIDHHYTGEDLPNVQCNYAGVSAGSLVRCRWIEALTWEVVNAECSVVGTGT